MEYSSFKPPQYYLLLLPKIWYDKLVNKKFTQPKNTTKCETNTLSSDLEGLRGTCHQRPEREILVYVQANRQCFSALFATWMKYLSHHLKVTRPCWVVQFLYTKVSNLNFAGPCHLTLCCHLSCDHGSKLWGEGHQCKLTSYLIYALLFFLYFIPSWCLV